MAAIHFPFPLFCRNSSSNTLAGWEQFIEYLSRVNEECCDEVDNRMQGIVRRMGLIAYRIMMVLTAVRHLENVYNVQADSNGIIQLVCQESDYFVAMNIC